MQLTYRGVSYEYNPPRVDFKSSETVGFGKYRGLDWRFRNPKKALVLQPTLDLIYRGVAYQANTAEVTPTPASVPEPATAPVTEVAVALQDRARMLMTKHGRSIKTRQQALLGRSAQQIGLAANISAYWNRIQGKVHPTFRSNYDRSNSTMS